MKDLTRHVHLVHMPTIAPEIGIAGEDDTMGEAGAAQEIYRCQWRGCPVRKFFICMLKM